MTSGDSAAFGLPATPSAAATTVDASRPCFRCGYDLFGQPRSGACPECGGPVAESLRPRYLRDAGPAYLRTVRQACRLAAVTIGLSLVGTGINGLMWHFAFPPAVHALRIAVAVATSSMLVLVAWRITAVSRSAGDLAGDLCDIWGPPWQRWTVRLAAAPVPLLQLSHDLVQHRLIYEPWGPDELYRFSWLAFTAAAAAVLLAGSLVGLRFARQVRRLPGPRLAIWAVLATAGMTAAAGVEAIRAISGLGVVADWWPENPIGGIERAIVVAEGVLLTIAFAVAVVTMRHVDRRLGEELKRAGEAPR